ncbi:hypothetical protein [Thioclava sp.]|uniref:hypothetical protein n=1 Tax=Thioclava sp. TaxID=1933450 RepID=UPI003AA865D5
MNAGAILWAICGGLLAVLPAHAANFTPPKGCEVYMTAQLHNCQVANFYTCAADDAGDQWVSYADGEGTYFLSHIDSETRWIEAYSLETGEIALIDQAASKDNASFNALLASGRDDYDFITHNNFAQTLRYVGVDTLTGESVTIDGVPLEKCSFNLSEYDAQGQKLSTRSGLQYISRKYRIFLSGPESYENASGEKQSFDDSPARFDFPGDPGFSTATPEYDCDMMMTGLAPADERG